MGGRKADPLASGLPVGNYANEQVAISCTGLGEEIIEEGLAVRIAQRTLDGLRLKTAFSATFRELHKRHRRVGAIGLDHHGQCVLATTLPMLFAVGLTPSHRIESL